MSLPEWEQSGPTGRAVEAAALVAAPFLIVVHAARLLGDGERSWIPALLAATLALVCADFMTGVVHWIADTWGSEDWPLVGSRLFRPFRLHHINPDDLLRRDFIECNGDVAALSTIALVLTFAVPISAGGGAPVVFFVALAAWVLPTNQIHQWAHQSRPPLAARWAQRRGLILDGARHAVHHVAPFAAQYCILTGWCNRPLAALNFFPALERAIETITGLVPRGEEQARAGRVGPSA